MANDAKAYLYGKQIPQLFESMMTALMYEKPDDPVLFLENCLVNVRANNLESYDWPTFNRLIVKKDKVSTARKEFTAAKPLPPIDTAQSSQKECIEKHNGSEAEEMNEKDGQTEEVANRPKPIIFVLGGPGSGKGTQCGKIVQEFGFIHLSAGDLLRQEVAKGTEQGKQLEEIMKQGELVPAEVTVKLLKEAIRSNMDAVGYLIDGFPRELSQSKIFEEQVCEGSLVLMFECSEDVMVGRLVERGKTSGRVDDNEETIRKRLHTYNMSTLPVIEHFQKKDKVRKIDAGRPVDEVYSDVQTLFKEVTRQGHPDAQQTDGQLTQEVEPDGLEQDERVKALADKKIIFVIGGPGSGKGTHCGKVAQEFGFLHISAGDLLRKEIAKGEEQGKLLKEAMEQGKLVPAEVTIGLLKEAILSNMDAVGYLIDGFPRDLSQSKIFEKLVCEGSLVLMFECSEDVMMGRLVKRGKTSGRVDDNEETIRKRFHQFNQSTPPIIEHFQDKVRKIDSDRPVDEVYADVQTLFREITSS